MDKARQTAAIILEQITEQGAYANVALNKELNKREITELDRRFVTELVYGATKAWGTLDYILICYVNRPLAKIPPMIRAILRLALYQLFFMPSVPPSAAVNTAVDLAKKYTHPGTVKFVNAVLRSAVREPGRAAFPADDRNFYLALSGQHPLWLINRWVNEFGYEETRRLIDFNNAPPAFALRTNTLKTSRDKLLGQLRQLGGEATPSPWAPEGVIYRHDLPMGKITPLVTGLCQVQDLSSMLVAHVLAPKPHEFIIDACSAPGGKTTHIAALMQNKGQVVAADVHTHKLKLVEENAKRLGISIIETKLQDARQLGEIYADQADRVLIDAPCSGLGVLNRRADARWRKTEAQLAQLLPLQREILLGAAAAVKPGGVLVYSTCTTEADENIRMIENFLRERKDFSLEPVGNFLPETKREALTLQLYPQRDGVDGFFIARLRRG